MKKILVLVILVSTFTTANAESLCGVVTKIQTTRPAGFLIPHELTISGEKLTGVLDDPNDNAILTTALAHKLKVCVRLFKGEDAHEMRLQITSIEK